MKFSLDEEINQIFDESDFQQIFEDIRFAKDKKGGNAANIKGIEQNAKLNHLIEKITSRQIQIEN